MAGVRGRSGRPQLPLAVAEARGSLIKNPREFEGRVDKAEFLETIPLGMPSPEVVEHPGMLECWRRFAREVPWLRESDRTLLEAACWCRAQLLAAMRGDMVRVGLREVPATIDDKTISLLLRLLTHMGATCTSVGKIVKPQPPGGSGGAAAKPLTPFGQRMLTLSANRAA